MGWERWELFKLVKPWKGTLSKSGVSLHLYPDRGEGSFSKLANFPKIPIAGARVHSQHWWWWWSCKGSVRTFFTLIQDGNSDDDLGLNCVCNRSCAFSRLCSDAMQCWHYPNIVHNLNFGTQFPYSGNIQLNLEIWQILRLCGTLCKPITKCVLIENLVITVVSWWK